MHLRHKSTNRQFPSPRTRRKNRFQNSRSAHSADGQWQEVCRWLRHPFLIGNAVRLSKGLARWDANFAMQTGGIGKDCIYIYIYIYKDNTYIYIYIYYILLIYKYIKNIVLSLCLARAPRPKCAGDDETYGSKPWFVNTYIYIYIYICILLLLLMIILITVVCIFCERQQRVAPEGRAINIIGRTGCHHIYIYIYSCV